VPLHWPRAIDRGRAPCPPKLNEIRPASAPPRGALLPRSARKIFTPSSVIQLRLIQFWSEGANFGDLNNDGRTTHLRPVVVGRAGLQEAHESIRRRDFLSSADHARCRPGYEGTLGVENTYSDNFLRWLTTSTRMAGTTSSSSVSGQGHFVVRESQGPGRPGSATRFSTRRTMNRRPLPTSPATANRSSCASRRALRLRDARLVAPDEAVEVSSHFADNKYGNFTTGWARRREWRRQARTLLEKMMVGTAGVLEGDRMEHSLASAWASAARRCMPTM
jgi:hypothetical protein